MTRAWVELLGEWKFVRRAVGIALLLRASWFRLSSRHFQAINDSCRAYRLSAGGLVGRIAIGPVDQLIVKTFESGSNPLVEWYLQADNSKACAATFMQAGRGSNDLLRDLIVLKAAGPDEKGVILLKYARTFEAVVALLDLDRLRQRYTFVLEPCWAGYCDPALLMYAAPGQPVFVQCFTEEDYEFIARIGRNLKPIRLGPADWVNTDIFGDAQAGEMNYDLVMVANWGAHKRHATLFNALRAINDRDLRVLLVGFAWAGRTADDIRREAAGIGNPRVSVQILEGIPQEELAAQLRQCKAFVFLSRKEGDNKALVEAMFADVPAIVYGRSIGGAKSRINQATGVLSSDDELPRRIVEVLDRPGSFSPRRWALENTGSSIATRKLDAALRASAAQTGARYTRPIVEKVNSPNLAYRDASVRAGFKADYDFVLSCLRKPAA